MNYAILSVICISLIVILLFYMRKIKRPKSNSQEHFVVDGAVKISPGINNFLIDREAVEKCNILEYTNFIDPDTLNNVEDSQIYTNMRNILDAGRIKKYKPKDTTSLDNDKEYCFIYDDPITDLQDTMMFNKDCSITNILFANNPMISNVFVDNSQDNVYRLPYRKCVIEIDKKNVNRGNLIKFYKENTGKMLCDDKILALIQKINEKTREYVALEAKYKKLKEENFTLTGIYKTLSSDLEACIKEMDRLTKELDELIIEKNKNQNKLEKDTDDLKICNANYKSGENIRDVYMKQKTEEKATVNENLLVKVGELKVCNAEGEKLSNDVSRYDDSSNKISSIYNEANRDKTIFDKKLETCMGNKLQEDKRFNDNEVLRAQCFPYIDDAFQCNKEKVECDSNFIVCDKKRVEMSSKCKSENEKLKKCNTDLPPKKESLQVCLTSVNYFVEDNNKKLPVIDENKETIKGLWKDVKQCNLDLSRVETKIKGMQKINTDLYNELANTNKQCADDTLENINAQIEEVNLDDTLITEEAREKEIKESATECKLGMYNCLKGNATNYSSDVIDLAGGRTEDAQYCAEACAKDTRCRAIYFNEGEKRCFKLSKPFETTTTEGLARTIGGDEVLGYTANFYENTRSTTCPLGAMNCMNAVGISTKDKVVVNEKSANTFDECINQCHDTEKCKSVSYSKDTKTCKMFNNFFSEHNENKEPVRYADSKYLSADIGTGLCLSMEWSKWGPCVETEFCTGKGVSERTKGSGGAGCLEEKMYRPCDVPFKRTELEVEKWSACSVKCAKDGQGTRTKFKNRCNDEILTDVCTGKPCLPYNPGFRTLDSKFNGGSPEFPMFPIAAYQRHGWGDSNRWAIAETNPFRVGKAMNIIIKADLDGAIDMEFSVNSGAFIKALGIPDDGKREITLSFSLLPGPIYKILTKMQNRGGGYLLVVNSVNGYDSSQVFHPDEDL